MKGLLSSKIKLLCLGAGAVYVVACTVALAQDDSAAGLRQGRPDDARQLIRQTPHFYDSPNPLAVIRVVNCLHSLGKQQAIALLREIAPKERLFVIDPDDSEETEAAKEARKYDELLWNAQRVSTIIPALFEVVDGEASPPAQWYDKDQRQWSIGCGVLVIQDGIPFHAMMGVWELSGGLGTTLPLVDWAAAHGKWREKPLVPEADPLEAADNLYSRIVAGAVAEFPTEWVRAAADLDLQGRLRAQACQLLPRALRDQRHWSWDELRKDVAQDGIHWDHNTQAFLVGGGPTGAVHIACPK